MTDLAVIRAQSRRQPGKLACARPGPVCRHGFTLLEILVVMAIVGILLGLAVVRLDDAGQRVTRNNAERLSLALEAARDTAIYSGQPIAFSSDGEGYQFWHSDDKQHKWLALTDAEQLQARKLSGEVRLVQQAVNGRSRPLGERLVFAADGLSEPFALVLQGGQAQVRIEADALGRIAVQEAPEDADAH